ncbi:MAG: magnesium chelatase subunit [Methanolobus sp.]|uniref:Mg-chelatase subunit ChlD n=1 Tax=Methanolobus tindarius DSM 2278 TaxID=1090322 RepID=W9DNJ0_METTI|nr:MULTISPECIES: VWA domain-containing protein [Methanolobus]ETA67664.1 Mg-chelatase subunit ChlD [Methanolobus tindarius DSM 2278]MDK2832473.1 magnesium chelatase subunit [Methanolobus sp.]MDK2939054.1 magnesium chelatase subunit [Methanolobus sp.]
MDDELVQRLRRNLPRNYGIKVLHLGYPVLGLRIPRASVSHFSKQDTDILYENLYANMEQIRPGEIEDVCIVADSDHISIEPETFFKPLIGTSDSAIADVFRYAQKNIAIDDAIILPPDTSEPDSSLVEDIIPKDTFVATENSTSQEIDPERSVFADILKPVEGEEVSINKVPDEHENLEANDNPEVQDSLESQEVPEEDYPVEELSFEAPVSLPDEIVFEADQNESEEICVYEPEVCVELTPKEYVPILSHDELEEELGDESRVTKSESSKLFDDLKEDKTVGKILNDFARNSQKKRLAAGRLKSGRRAEVLTKSKRGRYVRYRMPGEKITDIAIAPTVRAAAHHAKDGKIEIKKGDIREKVRRRRISSLINIVFDTSGSMDESDKVQITTSVVLALLKDAYQRRDRVSLVTYSGRSGELVLPFTSSVEAAKRYLEKVPFGGTTPMASGMLRGLDTLIREVKKEPSAVPIMILVTDGTANSPLHLGGNIRREIRQVCKQIADHRVNILVVDISATGSMLAKEVAMKSNGSYYHPMSLSKEALYSAITQERDQVTAFSVI